MRNPESEPTRRSRKVVNVGAGAVGSPLADALAQSGLADVIVELADRVDADLIVLGTQERSLLERALGMSVSGEVSRKADCDVLIVR